MGKIYDYKIGDHISNDHFSGEIVQYTKDKQGRKTYVVKCDKCHQNSVRNGHELAIRIGCSVCAGRTVVPGYNDIPTTAPWMVPYFSGGVEEASKYTCSSGKKFTPICPNCGRLSDHKTSPNRLMKNHSIGCSCGDGISIPNKFIWSVFEQLMGQNKISDFQREYQITDREGTPRKIDIYFETLDGSEYCVQMDGGYHPDIIQKHSKDEFHPLPIQDFIPDIMKEYHCEDNGITLTRVDCYQSDFNYIKSELFKTELPDVVDLSEIDWKEVEQYCGTSLMADVCKYKADRPNKFAPEVAKIFGINPSTVRNYWHWGTDLGLCKYDPNEAKARETKLRIPVTVLDENTNVISEYPSITKWVEDSPNVLGGYKMTKKMMENRHKKYHGQPFEFVTPDNNFKVLITVSERK